MTKTTFEKNIIIDKSTDSKIISGHIRLKSSETITIDSVNGKILFEARGRMRGYKKELMTLHIENNKVLTANQTYEIPFTFDASSFEIDSYQGKNVTFSYKIEIQIDINSNDIEKVERSVFSKVKSFVTNDYTHTINASEYFDVKNATDNYHVEEATTKFIISPNLLLVIVALALVVGTYIYFNREFNLLNIILGFISLGFIIYLTTNFIAKALGDISMQTLRSKDGFTCKLIKTRRFNLISPSIHYEITEIVVDKRGTSTSTSKETLYVSKKMKVPNFNSNPNLQFSYPETKGLQSVSCGDASILWQMKIKGSYMGLKIKYSATFNVSARE